MKRYTLILSSLLISCSGLVSDQTLFGTRVDDTGLYELYFLQHHEIIEEFQGRFDNSLISEFRISDQAVVDHILREWTFPKTSVPLGIPIYKIEISRNYRPVETRTVTSEFTIFSSQGFLDFDESILSNYKNSMINLTPIDVIIENRSQAIQYMNHLIENGAFLPSHHEPYPFEDFEGSMTLEYPKHLIPEDIEDPFEYVIHLLPFKAALKSGSRADTSSMSVIEIYSEKPEQIPENILVAKEWAVLSNIEVRVYNKTESQLQELARELEIKMEIKKIYHQQ